MYSPLTYEQLEQLKDNWRIGVETRCPKCDAIISSGYFPECEWESESVIVVTETVGCDECGYEATLTRRFGAYSTDAEILD